MKLIALKSNLIEAISSVEKAVDDGQNLPILKHILVKTEDNKIMFTGTNLELAITHTFSGKIIEGGRVAIPLGIFSSIIRNINSERITLELKNKKMFITTDNYEASIQSQDEKEFPIIPSIHNTTQFFETNTKNFASILNSVIVATQYSEIRPEISGVFINSTERGVAFVATDSFRLAELFADSSQFKSNFTEQVRLIIPLRSADEVLKIFNSQEEEVLKIFIDPTQILFKTQTIEAVSRLIDGNFPDYQTIIPKQTKTEMIASRAELVNAIKLTSSFSGRTNDITLEVGDSKKYIEFSSSNNTLGESLYKIPVRIKGDKFKLVFNWKYLLDGLKAFKSEEIIFGVNSPEKPIVVRSQQEPYLIYVVMPIKN